MLGAGFIVSSWLWFICIVVDFILLRIIALCIFHLVVRPTSLVTVWISIKIIALMTFNAVTF